MNESSGSRGALWLRPRAPSRSIDGYRETNSSCYNQRMGELVRWFFDYGGQLIESAGIMLSLCFAAVAFRADAKTRKADILIRITEGHREIWTFFEEHEELYRIFNADVDLSKFPPTMREQRFVQFVINHIVITYRSSRLGIYQEPEALEEDIRAFFRLPIPSATWMRVRRFQDKDFREFFEGALNK